MRFASRKLSWSRSAAHTEPAGLCCVLAGLQLHGKGLLLQWGSGCAGVCADMRAVLVHAGALCAGRSVLLQVLGLQKVVSTVKVRAPLHVQDKRQEAVQDTTVKDGAGEQQRTRSCAGTQRCYQDRQIAEKACAV